MAASIALGSRPVICTPSTDKVPLPCSAPTNAAGLRPVPSISTDRDTPPEAGGLLRPNVIWARSPFARSRRARADRPSGVSRKAALAVRAPPATRAVSSSSARDEPSKLARPFRSCAASPGRSAARPASKLMPPLTSSNSGRPNGSAGHPAAWSRAGARRGTPITAAMTCAASRSVAWMRPSIASGDASRRLTRPPTPAPMIRPLMSSKASARPANASRLSNASGRAAGAAAFRRGRTSVAVSARLATPRSSPLSRRAVPAPDAASPLAARRSSNATSPSSGPFPASEMVAGRASIAATRSSPTRAASTLPSSASSDPSIFTLAAVSAAGSPVPLATMVSRTAPSFPSIASLAWVAGPARPELAGSGLAGPTSSRARKSAGPS